MAEHPTSFVCLPHQKKVREKEMPALETERLILRDFVLSDWEALNALLSDPDVTRYMH
jgi:RimJ/RimL family protein N-acetyltransferase